MDGDLDPRSYEAAVRHAVVREAERIVGRAASGPSDMQRLTSKLFGLLDPDRQVDEIAPEETL